MGIERAELGAGLESLTILLAVRNASSVPAFVVLPEGARLLIANDPTPRDGAVFGVKPYLDMALPPGITVCSIAEDDRDERPERIAAVFSVAPGSAPTTLSMEGFPDIDVAGPAIPCSNSTEIPGELHLPATVSVPLPTGAESALVQFEQSKIEGSITVTLVNPSAANLSPTGYKFAGVSKDAVLDHRLRAGCSGGYADTFFRTMGPVSSQTCELYGYNPNSGYHVIFFVENTSVVALLGD